MDWNDLETGPLDFCGTSHIQAVPPDIYARPASAHAIERRPGEWFLRIAHSTPAGEHPRGGYQYGPYAGRREAIIGARTRRLARRGRPKGNVRPRLMI